MTELWVSFICTEDPNKEALYDARSAGWLKYEKSEREEEELKPKLKKPARKT